MKPVYYEIGMTATHTQQWRSVMNVCNTLFKISNGKVAINILYLCFYLCKYDIISSITVHTINCCHLHCHDYRKQFSFFWGGEHRLYACTKRMVLKNAVPMHWKVKFVKLIWWQYFNLKILNLNLVWLTKVPNF